jgi:hypothetical protein
MKPVPMIYFNHENFCCTSSTAVRRTDEELSPRTDQRTSRCSAGAAGRAKRPPRGLTGCGVAHFAGVLADPYYRLKLPLTTAQHMLSLCSAYA